MFRDQSQKGSPELPEELGLGSDSEEHESPDFLGELTLDIDSESDDEAAVAGLPAAHVDVDRAARQEEVWQRVTRLYPHFALA
jgi:hypothetical protein